MLCTEGYNKLKVAGRDHFRPVAEQPTWCFATSHKQCQSCSTADDDKHVFGDWATGALQDCATQDCSANINIMTTRQINWDKYNITC